MLQLFTRTHPDARTVIIGLDNVWCTEVPERTTGRPFPEWMYRGSPWRGYGHVLNLYAVQEAGSELWTMLGFKRARYGRDGYTSFVPPESAYDPARVAAAFARWGKPSDIPASGGPHVIPTLPMLTAALHALPPGTRKVPVLHAEPRLGAGGAGQRLRGDAERVPGAGGADCAGCAQRGGGRFPAA